MWALQRLRKLLTTEYGQSININRLLGDGDGEARTMVSPGAPRSLTGHTGDSNTTHNNINNNRVYGQSKTRLLRRQYNRKTIKKTDNKRQ